MRRSNAWATCLLIITALSVAGCGETETAVKKQEPASVEDVEGAAIPRLTLTEDAVQRLQIQTEQVREVEISQNGSSSGGVRKVMPYSALLYDADGYTFGYSNPEALVFIRVPVVVDFVDGELVVLTDGPPAGTAVVTVGGAELYGVEFGIGK